MPSLITVLPSAADEAAAGGGSAPPGTALGGAEDLDEEAAAARHRPWVGGGYRTVTSRLLVLDASLPAPSTPARALASNARPTDTAADAVATAAPSPSASAAAGAATPTPAAAPRPTLGTPSGSCSLVTSPPVSRDVSRALSHAGCAACLGATRGAWGETFCRSCGRAYVKSRTWRDDVVGMASSGGKKKPSWCDVTMGSIALWVHRTLSARAMPEL